MLSGISQNHVGELRKINESDFIRIFPKLRGTMGEKMCKNFVTDYEFVKVNDHKSHLLINCTNLEKLGAEMESPFAKEWDKKNNCKDVVYSIELVG